MKVRVLGPAALEPGEVGLVRLHLPVALPLLPGDRYVLRESGRGETVGGGEVLDPSQNLRARRDVGIRNALVAAVEPEIPAAEGRQTIDATGKLVCPGLVDLHAHVYPEVSAIGLPADELVPWSATTTYVSAGDAGVRMALGVVNAFLDELSLFGIGASWGGFESLAIPFDCAPIRTATKWAPGGPTVRIHIGLEDIDDLIGDLERGFAAFAAAR